MSKTRIIFAATVMANITEGTARSSYEYERKDIQNAGGAG